MRFRGDHENTTMTSFGSRQWRLAGFAALVLLSLGIAGASIVVYGFLPLGAVTPHPDMRASFEAHPVGIYTHIFGSIVALILGPLQFSSKLRALRPALHRWSGRLYLGIGILVGGSAGLYMAFYAFGGIASRLGFACLASAWLYTGYRAYSAIYAGGVAAHRRLMVRNYALTLAAVTLRLWLLVSVVSGVPFEVAYPVVAWLCWAPNLVAAEVLLKQTHKSPGEPTRPVLTHTSAPLHGTRADTLSH